MSTNHNEANIGDIAKTVLMPGDPLRAKHFADIYLDNVKQFNSVRNMYGFTGTYKGKRVSIMGSGMGICSIGIYSYELFKHYDVDNIIRVGTCGSYIEDKFNLLDTVLVNEAFSFSTYAKVQSGFDGNITYADPVLIDKLKRSANNLGIQLPEVRTNSSDVIYFEDEQNRNRVELMRDKYGCEIVECECFALFHNAKVNHKKAAGLMQVVDLIKQNQHASILQRQEAGNLMFEIALGTVLIDD